MEGDIVISHSMAIRRYRVVPSDRETAADWRGSFLARGESRTTPRDRFREPVGCDHFAEAIQWRPRCCARYPRQDYLPAHRLEPFFRHAGAPGQAAGVGPWLPCRALL